MWTSCVLCGGLKVIWIKILKNTIRLSIHLEQFPCPVVPVMLLGELLKTTRSAFHQLQCIQEELRSKTLCELDLDRDKLPVDRALGLQWCTETDSSN